MNIGISNYSNGYTNKINFGMAKFSKHGLKRAEDMSDVYEPLKTPNEYYPADFFEKKKMFKKAPFAKALEQKLPLKCAPIDEDVLNISQTIIDCGASKNSFSNSKFIKQLVTSENYIGKLEPKVQKPIRKSICQVLKANWNNPEITDEETRCLVRMSTGDEGLTKKQEIALNGVLDLALAKPENK